MYQRFIWIQANTDIKKINLLHRKLTTYISVALLPVIDREYTGLGLPLLLLAWTMMLNEATSLRFAETLN